MSYIVMDCHPGYVILLDESGRFVKAANFHYEVGQIVYDPVIMKTEPAKHRQITRFISTGLIAAAACFMLFFGFHYYNNYLSVYSSIYLSINPEVQMDLNRRGTVVQLTGTNEDGKKLLEGYQGKGKDKVTVADELIDRAIEMGFLSQGGQVSFSIAAPDDLLFEEYGVELRTNVTEHLDGLMEVVIEIVDYEDNDKEKVPLSSSPSVPSNSSPESSVPENTPSNGDSHYNDTDYGTDHSDDTPVSSPASIPQNNNQASDYDDKDTSDTNYDNDDDKNDDDDDNDD